MSENTGIDIHEAGIGNLWLQSHMWLFNSSPVAHYEFDKIKYGNVSIYITFIINFNLYHCCRPKESLKLSNCKNV